MIQRSGHEYGPSSANRLEHADRSTPDGARAALETFYYALNQRDAGALSEVWASDPLAQLNNPLGGVLHGGDAIAALYERVLHGRVRLTVTFGDVVEFLGADHAVFAGRETGQYITDDGEVPLTIRTTRYFRYADGRWWQYHHHGSIDDAAALAAYQAAVAGGPGEPAR